MYNTLFTYLQYLCRNYMILCHAVIIKSTISIYKKCEPINLQLMSLSFVLGNMSKSALFCSFSWIIITGVNQLK